MIGEYKLKRCKDCQGSGHNEHVTSWEIQEYGEAAMNCAHCEGTGLEPLHVQ